MATLGFGFAFLDFQHSLFTLFVRTESQGRILQGVVEVPDFGVWLFLRGSECLEEGSLRVCRLFTVVLRTACIFEPLDFVLGVEEETLKAEEVVALPEL